MIDIAVLVLGAALGLLYRQVSELRDTLQQHQLRVATDYHSKEEVREVIRAELQAVHGALADIKAALVRNEQRHGRAER